MQPGDEVRVFRINVADISSADLRFRDLIDIAEASKIDALDLSAVLQGKKGTGTDRIRGFAAFAWIMERKSDPSLTFDDVLDGRVEVIGTPTENPTAAEVLTQS